MACLRQLLSGILTLILIMAYSVAEDTLNLSNGILPYNYIIHLRLHEEENIFISECNIHLTISKTINQISMSSENLNIQEATLFEENKPENIHKVIGHMYDSENKIITLYFKALRSASYTLNLKYSGFISIKGGFKQFHYVSFLSKKQGTIWLSETHFQPLWSRRIFPCWPSFLSNFKISIGHSNKYSVSSNVLIISVEHKHDIKWTHFDSIPSILPYHVSIMFTDLLVHDVDGDMWCRNETVFFMEFALAITKNITLYLEREWELFPKINYVAIPGLQEQNKDALNLRIIMYNEADIIYDERKHNVAQKFNMMHLIGYEIIVNWLHNLIRSYRWSNPWLRIGFPTFFATHVLNQSLPNTRIMDLIVVQVKHESLKLDVDKRMLPHIDQTDIVPAEIVNRVKAPAVLRMLQHVFNIEKFWEGFRTYLNKNNRISIDFWEDLKVNQTVFGTRPLMYPWVEHKGYPVLTVTRIYDTFMDMIKISVENLDMKDERAIPVNYATARNPNFNQTQPNMWLYPPFNPSGHVKMLNLNYKEKYWVIFNVQQTGYYRVNYDDDNWAEISTQLSFLNHLDIHVLNRAQLIDDAFHFMLLGKIRSAVFWELVQYLERETDYIAWYPMFKAMEYISSTFPFNFGIQYMQVKLKNMLDGLFHKIKYEEKPTDDDFTKALRQEAAQWICKIKIAQSMCIEMANMKLKQHLENNTNLSPWWKKWTYCYGLMKMDNTISHQVLNKLRENNDKIAYLTTCPNHLIEVNKYVSTAYETEGHIYKIQNVLKHFVYLISNYLNGNIKHLLEDFESIKPRQLSRRAALLILINNIYSDNQLEMVNKTFLHLEPRIQYKIEVRSKHQIPKGNLIAKRFTS